MIKSQVKKARKTVWKNRNYILASFLLITFFSAVGFAYPNFFLQVQEKFIEQLSGIAKDKNFLELAWAIFVNNARASLIGIVLGLFFGIMPFLAAVVNGYFLGAVMNVVYKKTGAWVLMLILPHGIFEIPALAIAFGLGMKFGTWPGEKKKWKAIRKNFTEFMRVYAFIVLPLLAVAAIVESALIVLV